MDKQDIIRMAREAGIEFSLATKEAEDNFCKYMGKFAALVAESEREAILKLAETPIGEYEVVVACGTAPAPVRIPRFLEGQFLIEAIRARGQQ